MAEGDCHIFQSQVPVSLVQQEKQQPEKATKEEAYSPRKKGGLIFDNEEDDVRNFLQCSTLYVKTVPSLCPPFVLPR